MRATAFLMRSIRQESRLLSHHLMRGAMAAVILYLFSMQYLTFSSKAAAGGLFAWTVVCCCYWFLTFVGGIHFSTAIVEEKEEQTLALLKMTGASSFSILAGKSIPRLAMVILFLCVIAPFLILALMLGGVIPLGLFSAILGIGCYAIMLSQIGLFAGVVCRNAPRAFLLTGVLWFMFEFSDWWYLIGTQLASVGGAWISGVLEDYFSWIPEGSLLVNLSLDLLTFTTSGALYSDDWLPVRLWSLLCEVWRFHMGFHLVVAAIFFLLSLVLFEPCTNRALGDGDIGAPREVAAAISRPRPWSEALAWKSWQYASGGLLWFWLRVAGVPLAVLVLAIGFPLIFDERIDADFVAAMLTSFGIVFFLINLARLFGRVFNAEIYGKTIASLVMLPQSTFRTLWAMSAGLLPAVCAGAVCAAIGFFWMMLLSNDFGRDFGEVFEACLEPWFWCFLGWNVVCLHLGVLLTTYVRYGGMIVGYVLLWIAIPICCTSFIGVLGVIGPRGLAAGGEELLRYLVPLGLIAVQIIACVRMQIATVKRVEELAAQ